MAVLCIINFCSCAGFTLLTTFFPDETKHRGISDTQNGLIFAVYAGVNIVSCPLFGYLLPTLGAKPTMVWGLGVYAISCVCFSYLELVKDPQQFVAIACGIRVFKALSCSAYLTASYSLLTHAWSERRTQAIGMLEMSTGIGLILGPMMGSLLYNINAGESGGNFGLPFRVMAGVYILAIPFVLAIVKPVEKVKKQTSLSMMLSSRIIDGEISEQLSFKQFLQIFTNPCIFATISLTIVCWSSMDFVMPVLQIHVKQLYGSEGGKDVMYTAYLFSVLAVSYGLSTPICGKLCTSLEKFGCRVVMVVGCLLIVLTYK